MYHTVHNRRPPIRHTASTLWRRGAADGLRNEHGQTVVEFALVITVLLLVVVGILSFSRAMNYNEQATHLVNEAARYATVNQVPSGATGTLGDWVRSQAVGEIKTGSGDVEGAPSICVSYPNGNALGQPVTVDMTFNFHWLALLKLGVASSTIKQSATMRIEVPPTQAFFAAGCS
jgi:hypothetical protein